MSDGETVPQSDTHPPFGGKSLASLQRPRYKSWRKKYRKMRVRFDSALEENRCLFKEEYKLEAIAKRLREEVDSLLELCLHLNHNPSIPPELRFDLRLPRHHDVQNVVPENITPEQANNMLMEYKLAVQEKRIPSLDLHVIRRQIDQRLAAQDVRPLSALEAQVSCPLIPSELPDEMSTRKGIAGDEQPPPGYMTTEQEYNYLLREDARLGDPFSISRVAAENAKEGSEEKVTADLKQRELERQVEILNPQSQHNWLRTHIKSQLPEHDDTESFASHEVKVARKRTGGGGAKKLAKQVGDRAVERARGDREGLSPSGASGLEEDDLSLVIDDIPGASAKKKGRDPDGTYRVKGGKSGAAKGGKRKRNGGDEAGTGGSATKKIKVDVGPE